MKEKFKILFATDFSSNSRAALPLLKQLQKLYQTDLALIHVVPSFWKDWFASGAYQKEALERLLSWQLELPKKQDKKKLFVKCGNPADMILQTAQGLKSNLIILGSKAATSSGRYKTGATVEAVARHAKKSVWICKNHNISKILCGIDGSSSSAKALQFAIDLSRLFSASLCIVSALPQSDFNPLGMTKNEIKRHEEKFKTKQVDKLNRFLKRFDFSGVSIEKCFPWGTPANIILDMAEDFNYDLIIVGAKGHSKLHHILIGSTTEKILRYAPCSLLVVR